MPWKFLGMGFGRWGVWWMFVGSERRGDDGGVGGRGGLVRGLRGWTGGLIGRWRMDGLGDGLIRGSMVD